MYANNKEMRPKQYRFIIVIFFTFIFLVGAYFLSRRSAIAFSVSGRQNAVTEIDTSPQRKLVDRFVKNLTLEIDTTRTVGAAITVIYNNKIMLLKPYGVRQNGKNDSVNIHTVFRLASVSKGFAGVLACLLQRDSMLSLDEKIYKIIPGLRLKDSVNTYELSIRHILSHTTGLVPHAFDNLIEEGISYPTVIRELPTVDVTAGPGVLYSYQNVIFSLLDSIVFIKTGQRYDDLLEKKIFRPLKMRDASTNPNVFERRRSNVAHPHMYLNTAAVLIPMNTGYYNLKPAAGVNASISDLSKWLLALLGNRPDILDSTILNIIETPVIKSPLKRSYLKYWDTIDSKYYSLGWRIYFYKGRKVIYHGGYVMGYRAEIAFCPEEKVGIAFLENSPNELASRIVPEFLNNWFSMQDSTQKVQSTGD
jgi:beta-lactamase class C